MFVDKGDAKLCDECGEVMEVVGDYGITGEALKCRICGYYIENIDLHDTTLSQP
jgi:DNA-directed RNA polymerase subunit M/transcription elongation factor TFIIS